MQVMKNIDTRDGVLVELVKPIILAWLSVLIKQIVVGVMDTEEF